MWTKTWSLWVINTMQKGLNSECPREVKKDKPKKYLQHMRYLQVYIKGILMALTKWNIFHCLFLELFLRDWMFSVLPQKSKISALAAVQVKQSSWTWVLSEVRNSVSVVRMPKTLGAISYVSTEVNITAIVFLACSDVNLQVNKKN